MNYADLTKEHHAKIDELFAWYKTNTLGPKDAGHLAACIASDMFGYNCKKCTKKDANSFAAVLTYLCFTGRVTMAIN